MSAEAGDGPKQDNNNVPNQAKNWNEALDKYDSPNSAVVWIAWLLGQLVVSVLLLILSGFHFGLVQYDLCDSYNVSNTSNSTGSPTCEGFSGTILALAILACILSIFDAAMNLHYLTHKVFDGKPAANNNDQCKDGAERLSCFRKTTLKFPSNMLRVCYCWILVHAILVTVAANTYEWSWQTDDLSVLANTAIFFLTTTAYLLLIVAMVMWHGCCYTLSCCWREETDKNNSISILREKMTAGLMTAPLMTAGLIVSNTLCMAVTLVVFFCFKPDPSSDYSRRAVGLAFVLVYVSTTSIIWWVTLVYLYMYFDSSKRCKTKSFIIAIVAAVTIISGWIIPLLIKFFDQPLFGLLFFIFPFIAWVIGGISIIYCKSTTINQSDNKDGNTVVV